MRKSLKVKIFTSFILFVIFFYLICLTISAKESRKQIVKVGYLYNYGVLTDERKEEQTGYGYEYLSEIAKYTGWEYEFIQLEWNEALRQLGTGEIDILGPMQKTVERDQLYDFPEREMGFEYGALYVDKDKPEVYYNDTDSFENMKVGAIENNYFNFKFEEYCKTNGIVTNLVYTEAVFFEEKLRKGEIDAFLCGSLLDIPNTKVVAKFAVEPYYFAVTKGNKKVLDEMNMALDQILTEDAYYAKKLEEKYYGNKSINMPALTKEEVVLIGENTPLKVVCDPTWIPIEYYDEKNEEFTGANLDIMDEISKASGLNFEYINADTYGQGQAMIDSGTADLMLGYTQQCPDDAKLLYTDPVWRIPITLVGDQETDFNDHIRVGQVSRSSAISKEIMKEYPYFAYENYDTSKEMMAALQSGEIDAAFFNTYVYDEITRKQPADNYVSIPTSITFSQCIGIGEHVDPMVVSILNKSIKRLSPEQVSSIVFSNTVNKAYSIPLSRIIKDNAIPIIVLLIVFFIAILCIVRRNQMKLRNIAYIDALTGASTLTKLKDDTAKVLKTALPSQYALVAMDIDDFKYINDVYGYDSGTDVLGLVVKYFKKFLDKDELIARMHADHFVLLCKKIFVEYLGDIAQGCSDFREYVGDVLPGEYNITFSIGVYQIDDVKESFSYMFDKANFARKSVKGNRNLSMVQYTEDMNTQSAWKKEVTLAMDAALLNHEFVVYLQPKYLLNSEKIVGAEALIRWNHPKKGLLSPFKFIPIFEQNGFIKQIDLYVFEEICRLIRKWKDTGIIATLIPISVNLSRLHMYNILLAQDLLEIVGKYDIPTKYIEIELTESTVFYNTKLLIDIMQQLRAAGFLISIDDFGSGYSSLSMLKDIPADILKIDKEFLEESSEVRNGRVIIDSIIKLSKSLNLVTVAEGTETKEQVAMLRDMGCDIAQGYYFAKPLPVMEFETLCKLNMN